MAIKYYYGKNTGKGFITHEDQAGGYISGYSGDIWVTENESWATSRGLVEKTKEEAQAISDSAISASNSIIASHPDYDPNDEAMAHMWETGSYEELP